MSDNLFKIEPLHPQILKAYRGRIQGDFDAGVDLEFDSLRSAAAWAETCSIAEQVALQDNAGGKKFTDVVSVTYFPKY